MGLGAIEAIEAAGLVPGEDIKIVTVDAVKDGMQALADGKINFIVECSPLLGKQLIEIVKRVNDGETAREAHASPRNDTQEQAIEALPDRQYFGQVPRVEDRRRRVSRPTYRSRDAGAASSTRTIGRLDGEHRDPQRTRRVRAGGRDARRRSASGVKALDGVDFRMFPGEVHSLMGENGAGKSTLIKALTGVYGIDAGTITLTGEQVSFSGPAQAQAAGISTVYQEVNLLPNLSVAENILLGREPRRLGGIDWRAMRRRSAEPSRGSTSTSTRRRCSATTRSRCSSSSRSPARST